MVLAWRTWDSKGGSAWGLLKTKFQASADPNSRPRGTQCFTHFLDQNGLIIWSLKPLWLKPHSPLAEKRSSSQFWTKSPGSLFPPRLCLAICQPGHRRRFRRARGDGGVGRADLQRLSPALQSWRWAGETVWILQWLGKTREIHEHFMTFSFLDIFCAKCWRYWQGLGVRCWIRRHFKIWVDSRFSLWVGMLWSNGVIDLLVQTGQKTIQFILIPETNNIKIHQNVWLRLRPWDSEILQQKHGKRQSFGQDSRCVSAPSPHERLCRASHHWDLPKVLEFACPNGPSNRPPLMD